MESEKSMGRFLSLFVVFVTVAVISGAFYLILLSETDMDLDPLLRKNIFTVCSLVIVGGILVDLLLLIWLHLIYKERDLKRLRIGQWVAGIGILVGIIASGLDSDVPITLLRHAFFVFGLGVALVGIVLFFPAIRRS